MIDELEHLDPEWVKHYLKVTNTLGALYGVAFRALNRAVGPETALVLAPAVLKDLVASAESEAGRLTLLDRQEQQEEAERQALAQQLEERRQRLEQQGLSVEQPW